MAIKCLTCAASQADLQVKALITTARCRTGLGRLFGVIGGNTTDIEIETAGIWIVGTGIVIGTGLNLSSVLALTQKYGLPGN